MEKVLERNLENLRGKYIKQTLTNLELQGVVSIDNRKTILDGFNDYHRDILKALEELYNDSQKEYKYTKATKRFTSYY